MAVTNCRAASWWPGACPRGTGAALILAVACLVLFSSGAVRASDEPLKESTVRPKIGLVLSGGGARGAAHIGVLRVLEQLHIPIDYIAGTSMGSIVGGLYASGMTPEQIEKAYQSIDWNTIFDDDPPRKDWSFRRKRDDDLYVSKATIGFNHAQFELPSGIVQGQKFDLELRKLVPQSANVANFNQLPTPFRAVATNVGTGKPVVFSGGDIVRAMRASMAVPGIFAPVKIGNETLVDGGISDNLPIDVVRRMGADIIIAVDISTPLNPNEKLGNLISITTRLVGILTTRNVDRQKATLTKSDILIVPNLGHLTSVDFSKGDQFIAAGLKAALADQAELRKLSVSAKSYDEYLARRRRRAHQPPVIQFVDIKNNSGISSRVIRSKISQKTGQPLNVAQLDKDIGNVYGLKLFDKVDYHVVRRNGETGLQIDARRRSWGPNYLQFGLNLTGDLGGDNSYNFGISYLKTALNSLDGEARVGAQFGDRPTLLLDWYQPVDANARFFVEPRVLAQKLNVPLYSENAKDKLAEYRVKRYLGELAGGINFGSFGEFRLGYRRAKGDISQHVGTLTFPTGSYDTGAVFGQFWVDRLNDPYFPTAGYTAKIRYSVFRHSLGNDNALDQVASQATWFYSVGGNTFGAGAQYNATLDGEPHVQNRFFLGGFLHLSGFPQDSLSGPNSALLDVFYYHKIVRSNLVPAYLGGSLEYGNVWERRSEMSFDSALWSGSLFVGVDTPLGPLYIGYGQAEHGHKSGFLYLGKTF